MTAFLDGRVILHPGDCLEVLATLEECSVDSVVTDPPYGLEFMGKGWDGVAGFRRSLGAGVTSKPGIGERDTKWVSNQGWNQFRCETCGLLVGHGGSPCRCDDPKPVRADNRWPMFQQFMNAVAIECLRVLKPGGHLLAFGGTRTHHRLACAIEDAGFEIRDTISWNFGSGFPKSHDVSKGIDRAAGAAREIVGPSATHTTKSMAGAAYNGNQDRDAVQVMLSAPATEAARQWQGWGTALKPAMELICVARKPLIGTVAANVLKHGTGAINIDGCRVGVEERSYDLKGGENLNRLSRQNGNDAEDAIGLGAYGVGAKQVSIGSTTVTGRWPANVIHDGGDEVAAAFPDGRSAGDYPSDSKTRALYSDAGSAARFFYTAKADSDDRLGSKHPTVKPVDLMQWLVRLVTPKGGLVLDPFAGTGTTGEAAWREGMRAVLIEREAEYCTDIERRMRLCLSGPDERARESIKARNKDKPVDHGPLFGEWP